MESALALYESREFAIKPLGTSRVLIGLDTMGLLPERISFAYPYVCQASVEEITSGLKEKYKRQRLDVPMPIIEDKFTYRLITPRAFRQQVTGKFLRQIEYFHGVRPLEAIKCFREDFSSQREVREAAMYRGFDVAIVSGPLFYYAIVKSKYEAIY